MILGGLEDESTLLPLGGFEYESTLLTQLSNTPQIFPKVLIDLIEQD